MMIEFGLFVAAALLCWRTHRLRDRLRSIEKEAKRDRSVGRRPNSNHRRNGRHKRKEAA